MYESDVKTGDLLLCPSSSYRRESSKVIVSRILNDGRKIVLRHLGTIKGQVTDFKNEETKWGSPLGKESEDDRGYEYIINRKDINSCLFLKRTSPNKKPHKKGIGGQILCPDDSNGLNARKEFTITELLDHGIARVQEGRIFRGSGKVFRYVKDDYYLRRIDNCEVVEPVLEGKKFQGIKIGDQVLCPGVDKGYRNKNTTTHSWRGTTYTSKRYLHTYNFLKRGFVTELSKGKIIVAVEGVIATTNDGKYPGYEYKGGKKGRNSFLDNHVGVYLKEIDDCYVIKPVPKNKRVLGKKVGDKVYCPGRENKKDNMLEGVIMELFDNGMARVEAKGKINNQFKSIDDNKNDGVYMVKADSCQKEVKTLAKKRSKDAQGKKIKVNDHIFCKFPSSNVPDS